LKEKQRLLEKEVSKMQVQYDNSDKFLKKNQQEQANFKQFLEKSSQTIKDYNKQRDDLTTNGGELLNQIGVSIARLNTLIDEENTFTNEKKIVEEMFSEFKTQK
jgi:hypothetical protein